MVDIVNQEGSVAMGESSVTMGSSAVGLDGRLLEPAGAALIFSPEKTQPCLFFQLRIFNLPSVALKEKHWAGRSSPYCK